jgi:ribosome small subunit-dependent GTPase A
MSKALAFSAASGTHQGDRETQQDRVCLLQNRYEQGCLLSIVADGMGGLSGGRIAADQVMLTPEQLFQRYTSQSDSAQHLLEQIVDDSHLVIGLNAMTTEEQPHSTFAGFLVTASGACHWAHVGERLRAYSKMGYRVLPLSLSRSFATNLDVGLSGLQQLLHNKVSLILGPSGAGKSTLINTLVPNANIWTQEISQALNSGKHTTTRTSWYWLSNNPDGAKTALIDSPGFQEFGLNHLKAVELAHNMPDFQPHIADCKFYNCTHLHEPQCAVLAQIKAGNVSTERYRIYGQLFEELSRPDY